MFQVESEGRKELKSQLKEIRQDKFPFTEAGSALWFCSVSQMTK